jgi:hypothetical protein
MGNHLRYRAVNQHLGALCLGWLPHNVFRVRMSDDMSNPATWAASKQAPAALRCDGVAVVQSGRRNVSVVLTTIVAGAVGCVIAYWTWRMVLRLPLAVAVDLGVDTGAAGARAAGAPWWVPTAIVGAVAMLLWPILAAHARRISLIGGSAAIVLVSILIFPIAAFCVQFAALTANGWPPLIEFVGALPRVIAEAVKLTLVNLMYSGLTTIPLAALIGLLLAAFGRLIAWTVEWLARMRAG